MASIAYAAKISVYKIVSNIRPMLGATLSEFMHKESNLKESVNTWIENDECILLSCFALIYNLYVFLMYA